VFSLSEPVVIEAEAPTGHVEAVELALRRAGIEASVESAYERKSAELLPWVIQLPVGSTLAAFFAKLGAEAAGDAYGQLKQLVADLCAARSGAGDGTGAVDFADDDYTHVVINADVPDEALRALLDIDWAEVQAGWLVWKDGEWYNATPRREQPE
jgi:hypothetical protein